MSDTVLLTGGFGNLGGRLSAFLHKQHKFNVRLGSRSARHAPSWASDAQTARLDVLDTTSLVKSLSDVDIVVHLAAMNSLDCAKDPGLAHAVNVEGTRNLLESAIAVGVKRIIYLSTAHVYAAPLVGTISESTIPQPQHPYSSTSLDAELLIKEAHDANRIVGIRVRCANGFGAPMDAAANIWQILVNDLCRQATEHGTLTLKSHGDQERNFIPLHDVCAAIHHLMDLENRLVGDGLFNLGHEGSLSVWEMTLRIAERCQAVLGFTPPIVRPIAKPNELRKSLDYRSDKIRATGFAPTGDIDLEIDGLLNFCANEFPRR